ncbi:MAG: hypothetical protein Q8Q04_02020 [archaeon]|nr:hypothetical protein [archaeon]
MTTIDSSNYINALKSRKLKDVKIASSGREELMKKQDKKCSNCKQELRPGYYKFVKNPVTKEDQAICSGCLVHIPERRY